MSQESNDISKVLCSLQKVLEFEALADMAPLQGRLVLNVLQTHHTGELLVPQTARGTRMEALLPLLRPEGSPAPTPSSAPGMYTPPGPRHLRMAALHQQSARRKLMSGDDLAHQREMLILHNGYGASD